MSSYCKHGTIFDMCPICDPLPTPKPPPPVEGSHYSYLRWHRLSELTRDDVGTIELLAATCVDGIGCIARWVRREEGGWDVSAMDTEGGAGMQPVTDWHEGEPVPPEPPTFFDDVNEPS